MDFDVLLELNKTPGKKQGCTTTAAQNAPNPGNCFPFVFFLYNLILSINLSGLYFQCNKRCIVKVRWRQETLITSSAFPKELVPPSSCTTKPPKWDPCVKGRAGGKRQRVLGGCGPPKGRLVLHLSGRLLANHYVFLPLQRGQEGLWILNTNILLKMLPLTSSSSATSFSPSLSSVQASLHQIQIPWTRLSLNFSLLFCL